MRCHATTTPWGRSHRADSSTEPRCRRRAVRSGLCVQHHDMYLQELVRQQRLAVHRQIVQRILEIPARD